MDIISNVINLLKIQGRTQKELMDYIGIHPNVFTDWKAGKNNSYLKHISAIAEFLGVSTDYLLEQKNKPRISPRLISFNVQFVVVVVQLRQQP